MKTTDIHPRKQRPSPDEYAAYYDRYVSHAGDGDVIALLGNQIAATVAYLRTIPESRGGHRYAEGKWSIRECIGHMADTERVFAYRALRFARNDSTSLPGFDQDTFVANAHFNDRSLASLIDEFDAIRRTTVALFEPLTPDEWLRKGTASDNPVSVRALAWIIAGHEAHHVEILNSRYA